MRIKNKTTIEEGTQNALDAIEIATMKKIFNLKRDCGLYQMMEV